MMSAKYNAVIVGQTGVGKSTLINYLYGQKVAEAGAGKPVTKNGFHPISFEINGLPICLFDSWGLEVGLYDKWSRELDKEFRQRGVNESADKWFHSVFYCINAGGARIQDCDISIIKKFIAQKYKISVILTKCDQVSEEIEESLRQEIQKQLRGISVISVCSEKQKTRTGVTEPFGKEDIERQAFNDFFDSLILRLPLRCKSIMEEVLQNWVEKSNEKVQNSIGFMGRRESETRSAIISSIEDLREYMQALINIEIKQTAEMYSYFAIQLGYVSLSQANRLEKLVETDEDYNWFVTVLAAVLSPVFIFKGRDWAVEGAEGLIHNCEDMFKDLINKQVEEVTRMLKALKLKVTDAPSFFQTQA